MFFCGLDNKSGKYIPDNLFSTAAFWKKNNEFQVKVASFLEFPVHVSNRLFNTTGLFHKNQLLPIVQVLLCSFVF